MPNTKRERGNTDHQAAYILWRLIWRDEIADPKARAMAVSAANHCYTQGRQQ